MATTRVITVWQGQYDLAQLKQSGYNFQIAKSVATTPGGPPKYNVVWKSKAIAPTTKISWDQVYALNWTADLPVSGAAVIVGGSWQQCAKGEVYDLDANGFWVKSSETPKPGFMSVGKVKYQYPNTPGINIVIGVQNESGDYDSIFVDPTVVFMNGSATYQPLENIQFWYESGAKTSTMISSAQSSVGSLDCSSPSPKTNKFAWWLNYITSGGSWNISQSAPMPSLHAPPPSLALIPGADQVAPTIAPTLDIDYFPVKALVALSIAVLANQAGVVAKIRELIATTNTEVSVNMEFSNGKTLSVEYGKPRAAPRNSLLEFGVPNSEAMVPIEQALNNLSTSGMLPIGESWTITPVN